MCQLNDFQWNRSSDNPFPIYCNVSKCNKLSKKKKCRTRNSIHRLYGLYTVVVVWILRLLKVSLQSNVEGLSDWKSPVYILYEVLFHQKQLPLQHQKKKLNKWIVHNKIFIRRFICKYSLFCIDLFDTS